MTLNTKFLKIKKGFSNQNFMTTLGAKIKESDPGKCTIILPFHSKLTQQHGLFHGGTIASIADNAAGFAAYSLMMENYQPLTIEFKINFRQNIYKIGFSKNLVQCSLSLNQDCFIYVNNQRFTLDNNGEVRISI